MDLAEVILVVAVAWIALLVIIVGLCRAAGRADSASDRYYAALR